MISNITLLVLHRGFVNPFFPMVQVCNTSSSFHFFIYSIQGRQSDLSNEWFEESWTRRPGFIFWESKLSSDSSCYNLSCPLTWSSLVIKLTFEYYLPIILSYLFYFSELGRIEGNHGFHQWFQHHSYMHTDWFRVLSNLIWVCFPFPHLHILWDHVL